MRINVWHTRHHDDATVTEVEYAGDFTSYIRSLYEAGGLRDGNKFVPWHRINYIEEV